MLTLLTLPRGARAHAITHFLESLDPLDPGGSRSFRSSSSRRVFAASRPLGGAPCVLGKPVPTGAFVRVSRRDPLDDPGASAARPGPEDRRSIIERAGDAERRFAASPVDPACEHSDEATASSADAQLDGLEGYGWSTGLGRYATETPRRSTRVSTMTHGELAPSVLRRLQRIEPSIEPCRSSAAPNFSDRSGRSIATLLLRTDTSGP